MNKPSPKQIALLTRRLADLTAGGVTLNRSLTLLLTQTREPTVRGLLDSIRKQLESGRSFSAALATHNASFSPIFIGMIKAGESAGNVEDPLDELANLLESEIETNDRLRHSLAYPVFLLALSVGVSFFLTFFVVPRFEFLFQDLGQQLPWPTRILMGLTSFLKTFGPWLIPVTAIAVWRMRHKIKNRLPWVGEFAQTVSLHRWARVMASLLKGGFSVTDALRLSGDTLGNPRHAHEIGTVVEQVYQGRDLAHALSVSSFFPPMVCELVSAGEESGRLEQTLARLAETFKRESEMKLRLGLALFEPAMLLAMGIVVGFIALAMFLPLLEMTAGLK